MPSSITRQQWKVIFLSSLGGALEFYDFVIFAVFAISIGHAFFPLKNDLMSLMSAFLTFAAGYLARPIGGILFGHFGDKYGRKKVFILSISLMATAILLMGILPGYHQWGIIASIIFIGLRLLQGIAIGGEIPGAITFVKEHVAHYPGLACGIIFSFLNVGIFLADIVYGLLSTNFSATFAWRIAFIIGGLLAVLSYFLRKKLHESPEFIANQKNINKIPLSNLIRYHYKNLIFGFLMVAIQATFISMLYLYVVSYMRLYGHYSHEAIAYFTLINIGITSIFIPIWGWVTDYSSRRLIFIIGAICLIPLSILFYAAINHHHHVMFFYVLASICGSMVTGALATSLAHMFPTSVRFSGIALCYNLGFAILGGLSPALATYLLQIYQQPLIPGYLVSIVAVAAIIGAILAKQTYQTDRS